MPKYKSKFNIVLQKEFPFLKSVADSESDCWCTLCNTKICIASGGKADINKHLKVDKHVKGARKVQGSQAIDGFMAQSPDVMQLVISEDQML